MYDKICERLKNELDSERYEHTIGVMYTAGALAMAYGYDVNKAMLAGLLHDCAKCLTHEVRLELCKKHHVEVTESEFKNKSLLHAKVGAIVAKEVYHITDEEILHSIMVHTTGDADMNLLDKIIYIADYIEPLRDEAPHLDVVRKLAFVDLNACMAQILSDTLKHLNTRNFAIDPTTAKAYEFYKQYRREL